MFMGGIKENVTSEDVTEYFEKWSALLIERKIKEIFRYGNVESVELLQDKASGKKRGFGFVNFDDYDVVDKVRQTRKSWLTPASD